MNTRVKCILFDLDGTLVNTGGAGNRALERAFVSHYDIRNAMEGVDPSGKTDPAIIREIFLKQLKRNCKKKEMQTIQQTYLDLLKDECERAGAYKIMEGIRGLLKNLKRKKTLMGLGTGNLETGARIKLTRADLNIFFPFGGFGSDSENRAELLKTARKRAEKFSGKKVPSKHVLVVGDTERDILAAQKAGFKVLAVATGTTPMRTLKKYSPDYFLPDFRDNNEFLKIVQNGA